MTTHMTNTHTLVEQDRQHWVHPVAAPRQHEARGARIWTAAEGVHLIDSEGKHVQDAFSGLWDKRLGERVLERALEEGLVFRAFADDILGFAPALNYTCADVDTLMQILRYSLQKAVAELY